MKPFVFSVFLVFSLMALGQNAQTTQMVPNSTIGNDPEKEQLCIQRLGSGLGKAKPVPFLIAPRYVEAARRNFPDVVFVVVDDGSSPQLIECALSPGSGRLEPITYTPELPWMWSPIKPPQFSPGINTTQGQIMAAKVCLKAAPAKIERPNFDHAVYLGGPVEVKQGSRFHPGVVIDGVTAARYDIAVEGTSFYKAAGPDLDAVKFTCLLSPMLDVKAIQLKP
jgi:hypothetical protein